MCILFIAKNQHPIYPLIVAANRDEYHQRPSRSMHFWEDHPEILAGRDMEKGGTWLGINSNGDFSAVTNFRTGEPGRQDVKSRGELVQNFLQNKQNHNNFISDLDSNHYKYNPFNLIFGGLRGLNIFCSENGETRKVEDGFHSLSNGYIDEQWPKMSDGVQRLTKLIEVDDKIDLGMLNSIMRDETKADDAALPQTGVGAKVEKHISSIFICGEDYGTRTTTLLMYTTNHIRVYEYNFDRIGKEIDQQEFKLELK